MIYFLAIYIKTYLIMLKKKISIIFYPVSSSANKFSEPLMKPTRMSVDNTISAAIMKVIRNPKVTTRIAPMIVPKAPPKLIMLIIIEYIVALIDFLHKSIDSIILAI